MDTKIKVAETGGIKGTMFDIEGTTENETFFDRYGSLNRVFIENGKKMVETKEKKIFPLYLYEINKANKSEEWKKLIGQSTNKFDEEMKFKLLEVYSLGGTIEEKSNSLGVCPKTIYNWKKKFPDFFERLERLDLTLITKARQNIAEGLALGDIDLSKWFLEKKAAKEFGKNIDINVNKKITHQVDLSIIKDLNENELDEMLRNVVEGEIISG